MTVVQPCGLIKSHQTIFLRWVTFIVGKLYFNKDITSSGKEEIISDWGTLGIVFATGTV